MSLHCGTVGKSVVCDCGNSCSFCQIIALDKIFARSKTPLVDIKKAGPSLEKEFAQLDCDAIYFSLAPLVYKVLLPFLFKLSLYVKKTITTTWRSYFQAGQVLYSIVGTYLPESVLSFNIKGQWHATSITHFTCT